MKTSRATIISTVLIALLCVAAGALGFKMLAEYEHTPGASGKAPTEWPAGSALVLSRQVPTLVMLAHPRCPCTAASLRELEEVLAQSRGKLAVYVIFAKPPAAPSGWEHGHLWAQASALPGVHVLADEAGAEAARFGVETSGDTSVFAADGRLLFRGGITGARGHSGENAGRNALLASLNTTRRSADQTPVFGCPLH